MGVDVNSELRKLMDLYQKRYEKLVRDLKEAENDGDVEAELIGESLIRQHRGMVAELFQTMKNLGILDEEEMEIGALRRI